MTSVDRALPEFIWPVVAISLAGLSRLPTLSMPMIEEHAFRQTQTAFPALIWRNEPIDLLYPQVPVVGPPWSVPFEFPIVQAAGALLMRLGLGPEFAMRGLALASFLASAAVLWILLTRHAGRRPANIATAAFLFSPFAIEWSRASLIEYPAVLGALLFVLAAMEGGGRRRVAWFAVALIGGSAVALIKLSTATFWLGPAVLTRRPLMISAAAIAAGLGVAWTRHADAVKEANPFAATFASATVGPWMTSGDRLSIDTWLTILGPVAVLAGMLLLPLGLLVVVRRERMLWAWMAIALVGPPLLFTNMYVVHDYYTAAVTPAIAALIGGGADVLVTRWRITRAPLVATALIVVCVTNPKWLVAYIGADPDNVMAAVAVVESMTRPDDLIAMHHHDWSPAVFFYAGRRGLVIWNGDTAPPGYVDVGAP